MAVEGTAQVVAYPQVVGLNNQLVERRINSQLSRLMNKLTPVAAPDTEVTVNYYVEVNKNDVLSVRNEVYSYTEHAAHGLTVVNSLTVNTATGRAYTLPDLFRKGSDYVERLSAIIKQQIEEQQIPLINPFERIDPYEDYYLTESALVIYFQIYEYTPYYVNIPYFFIPYEEILDIVNPRGPIPLILADPAKEV